MKRSAIPGLWFVRYLPGDCATLRPRLFLRFFCVMRVHGIFPLTLTLSPEYRGEGSCCLKFPILRILGMVFSGESLIP